MTTTDSDLVTDAGHVDELAEAEPSSRVQRVAERLHCTEGQLYSMVIGLTTATALALVSGVPLGGTTKPAALPLPSSSSSASAPITLPPAPKSAPPPLASLPIGGKVTPAPPASAGPQNPGTSTFEREPSTRVVTFFSRLRVPNPGLPQAIASDGDHVFVGTDNSGPAPSQVFVYSSSGQLEKKITISGQPKNHSGGVTAAAVRGSSLVVIDRSRAALVTVDPVTGRQAVLATIPDLPPCVVGISGTCQPGAQDEPPAPESVVVAGKYAYVADAGQGTIWRYDFTARKLSAWYSSSDFGIAGPWGLGIDTSGSLLFTVPRSNDSAALLEGALYRLTVAADGAASTRTLVATFASADGVGQLAVGRAGEVYVALRGSGGVAVVSTAGKVTALDGASATKLPAPTGLNLVDGALLIADAGKPAKSTSGSVVAVRVGGGPAFSSWSG